VGTGRVDHVGRVGGVDDLVADRQLPVQVAEQVGLAGGVQAEAGLVQQQDEVLGVAQLREGGHEREEPDEPARAFAEVGRHPVAVVADADVQERRAAPAVLAGLAEVQVQLDGQLRVLAPVPEDLLADRGGGALQGRLADLVLGLGELVGGHPGQPQQGQRGPLPRLEVVGGGGLEPRDRHPAREDAVAVEVEQPGQPGGEQAGQLAGGRLVADQQAPVARVVPLDGDLLGLQRLGPEPLGHRLQVGVAQLEGGRDGGGAGDLGPVPPSQAARVVAQLVEPPDRPAERIGLAQGLQEGGLSALVPAHQTCHVRLETDGSRILDAPEFPYHCRFQDHVPLRLDAAGNVVEISRYVPIAGSVRSAGTVRVHLRREAAKDCA